MVEEFDPYRKWLGIPPADQPPNHYQLLGAALFEDDPEVIKNAADRQMTHVRKYQSTQYSRQSQELLNELSTAKVCLLNRRNKADYDSQLRRDLRRREEERDSSTTAPPPALPPSVAAPPAAPPTPPPAPPPTKTGSEPLGQASATASAPLAPTPVLDSKQTSQNKTPATRTHELHSCVSPAKTNNRKPPFRKPPSRKNPMLQRYRRRRSTSTWPLLFGIIGAAALLAITILVFHALG